jgi:hypothetical protein
MADDIPFVQSFVRPRLSKSTTVNRVRRRNQWISLCIDPMSIFAILNDYLSTTAI